MYCKEESRYESGKITASMKSESKCKYHEGREEEERRVHFKFFIMMVFEFHERIEGTVSQYAKKCPEDYLLAENNKRFFWDYLGIVCWDAAKRNAIPDSSGNDAQKNQCQECAGDVCESTFWYYYVLRIVIFET